MDRDNPIGTAPPDVVASRLCDSIGYMCPLTAPGYTALVAPEVSILETYVLIGDHGLTRECIMDDACFLVLRDMIVDVSELYERGEYFVSIGERGVRVALRIAEEVSRLPSGERTVSSTRSARRP